MKGGCIVSAIEEKELNEKIKENPTGAYLLYGEESYLVKTYVDKLSKATTDEAFRDFNLRIYDGDDISLSDVYDSVTAVPMMAESKCVIVKDYSFDDVYKGTNNDIENLEGILRDNPDDNCLIFSYAASLPKKNFKEIEKLFKKYGYAVDFSKKSPLELAKTLEKGAKKRGKNFENSAAAYMVKSVGSDLNLLVNELDKLCAYTQDETIKETDIDEICTKCLDIKVFDMVKDLTSRNFERAFKKLEALMYEQGEDVYMIIGALNSQYVDMYRAKALREAGVSFGCMGEIYQAYKNKIFKLESASRIASSMSIDKIRECLEILSDADTALKSTSEEKEHILERTLVRLSTVGR
jgi:DNA polymerase III subunit delta